MCLATAASVTTSARAIAAFDRPSAMSESTSRSRGVSRADRVPPPPEQLADDLGIDGRAAIGDPGQRVHELLDPPDPVLEQIADAASTAGVEQLGRVGRLHVLAEHEHRQRRVVGAQGHRRPQPLVGEPGRHAYVGDHHVGRIGPHGHLQRLGVPDGGGHGVAEPRQQPDQPLPQQHRVLGDDYPEGGRHGSSTRMRVGPPGGLDNSNRPP